MTLENLFKKFEKIRLIFFGMDGWEKYKTLFLLYKKLKNEKLSKFDLDHTKKVFENELL